MGKVCRILGFAGSLRKDSYNKSLLKAALELVPEGVELEIFDLEGIPPFNQDLENQPGRKVERVQSKNQGCGRHTYCDAGIQLFDPRRVEECHRLCFLTLWRQRV